MQLRFKVFRFDPDNDPEHRYQEYHIAASPNERILDCLNRIRWTQDPTLSYRWSCVHGICGSDGMTINGTPSLACQKLVKDYTNTTITLEPLSFFPIIKDLIVDMTPFYERLKSIHPQLPTNTSPIEVIQSIQTHDDWNQLEDSIRCVMCGSCVSACPVNLGENSEFIGPAASLRSYRYIFDSRRMDRDERLRIAGSVNGVRACKVYAQCTRVCPKGIKITKNILRLKNELDIDAI